MGESFTRVFSRIHSCWNDVDARTDVLDFIEKINPEKGYSLHKDGEKDKIGFYVNG